MMKRKLLFVAIGLVAGASVIGYGAHTIVSANAAAPKTIAPVVAVSKTTSLGSVQDSLDTTEVKIANKLDLATPKPIEHYIWYHRGDSDEVWNNPQIDMVRIEQKHADGHEDVSIYRDGFLYVMHKDANGNLISAQKFPQKVTQPDHLFQEKQVKAGNKMSNIGSENYDGVDVDVMQNVSNGLHSSSQKLYVDKKYHLPLKSETTVGGHTYVETWGYSYQPNDDSLFTLPRNVNFQLMSVDDGPGNVKGK